MINSRFSIQCAVAYSVAFFQFLATPSSTFASGQEGHGGNAIVCFSDAETATEIRRQPMENRAVPTNMLSHIVSIKALDLYGAENRIGSLDAIGGLPVSLIQPRESESNTEYLLRIARRFDNTIPLLSRIIHEGIEKLSSSTTEYEGDAEIAGIAQVFDVGNLPYVIESEKCILATLARQSGSMADGTLRLDLDGRLMNHPAHSDFSRKVILLHEIFYAWGRDRNQSDSGPTRELVSKVIQTRIRRDEITNFLTALKFAVVNDSDLYVERRFDRDLLFALQHADLSVQGILKARDFDSFTAENSGPNGAYTLFKNGESRHRILIERENAIGRELFWDRSDSRRSRQLKSELDGIHAEVRIQEKRMKPIANEVNRLEGIRNQAYERLSVSTTDLNHWASETLLPQIDTKIAGRCLGSSEDVESWLSSIRAAAEDYLRADPLRTGRKVPVQATHLAPICDDYFLPVFP
jgi:hypothetical protein